MCAVAKKHFHRSHTEVFGAAEAEPAPSVETQVYYRRRDTAGICEDTRNSQEVYVDCAGQGSAAVSWFPATVFAAYSCFARFGLDGGGISQQEKAELQNTMQHKTMQQEAQA